MLSWARVYRCYVGEVSGKIRGVVRDLRGERGVSCGQSSLRTRTTSYYLVSFQVHATWRYSPYLPVYVQDTEHVIVIVCVGRRLPAVYGVLQGILYDGTVFPFNFPIFPIALALVYAVLEVFALIDSSCFLLGCTHEPLFSFLPFF
jgi:hypothetical protein